MTTTVTLETKTTRIYTFTIREIVDILKDHISEKEYGDVCARPNWDGVEFSLVFRGGYEHILDEGNIEAIQLVAVLKSGEKRTE